MTTSSNEKSGQQIAKALLEERLAACVTISAPCQSHYWWQGKISKEQEHILFIKTQASLYSRLEKKIIKIHPYQVPEIVVLPLIKGYRKYFDWISKETEKKSKR